MNHVLTKYTFLVVIKSGNSSAFRNELASRLTKYAGLRRASVLPYNALASGAHCSLVGLPHAEVSKLA
eukprot:1149568-Pleurochrysis_carterae.AAC.1